MLDILIKNAELFQHKDKMDLGIKDGIITYKKPAKKENKKKHKKLIDGSDRLVTPGFVDSHTHLAKALTRKKISNERGTLQEAIEKFSDYFKEESEEEVYKRELNTIKKVVRNGTTVIRTHIAVNPEDGLKGMRPILELKEELKDFVTIQVVAFAGSPPKITKDRENILKRALELGADLVGGCPHLSDDYVDTTDKIFKIAKEYNVDIDLHVDESDEPNVKSLEYLAEKTIAENYEGRVTAGHCTALSVVDDERAKMVIEKVKKANIHVITLPSCNMFLMGRNDSHPVRRGITRVKEFIDRQVNISYASDNIRDPFRPFGNGDMLEEGLFTAQVIQYGTSDQLETIMRMGTYNPAKALGLTNYGLDVGNTADIVVLDSPTSAESLIKGSEKLYVIKSGNIVATNHEQTELFFN